VAGHGGFVEWLFLDGRRRNGRKQGTGVKRWPRPDLVEVQTWEMSVRALPHESWWESKSCFLLLDEAGLMTRRLDKTHCYSVIMKRPKASHEDAPVA